MPMTFLTEDEKRQIADEVAAQKEDFNQKMLGAAQLDAAWLRNAIETTVRAFVEKKEAEFETTKEHAREETRTRETQQYNTQVMQQANKAVSIANKASEEKTISTKSRISPLDPTFAMREEL